MTRTGLISPHQDHPHLVLLQVDNESALELAARNLRKHHINYREFREPDLGDSLTALATEPIHGPNRKLFHKYTLVGA